MAGEPGNRRAFAVKLSNFRNGEIAIATSIEAVVLDEECLSEGVYD
jgi:hypothetical protein